MCESGGVSPLLLASAGGYNLTVRELLAHGADPNCRNPDGDTALMYAAFKGYLPSVQALLARGARVNDQDQIRPYRADASGVAGSFAGCAVCCCNKGAQVNIKARNGWATDQLCTGRQPYRHRPDPPASSGTTGESLHRTAGVIPA